MTDPLEPGPPRRGFRPGRHLWRAAVFVVGTVVLLMGLIMIFTPGPAIVFVPAGLAILATEFAWAKGLADKAKARLARWREGRKG